MQILQRDILDRVIGGLIDDSSNLGNGGGGPDGAGPGGAYDVLAVGVQGGADAVVRIQGLSGLADEFFMNTPITAVDYNVPVWVEVQPISTEHKTIDGAILGLVTRVAGGAAVAIIDGFIVGAEIGSVGGPAVLLAGAIIGAGAAAAAQYYMDRDHGKAHWELHPKRVDAPE